MVTRRVSAPHQCQGVLAAFLRKAENRVSCMPLHRQHTSGLLHQQHGRHSFMEADGAGHSDMGMEPGQRDFPGWSAP